MNGWGKNRGVEGDRFCDWEGIKNARVFGDIKLGGRWNARRWIVKSE